MARKKVVRLDLPAKLETYKTRDAWEASRNSDPERLGASDVSALWGMGYRTPLSLWQEVLRRRRGDPPEPTPDGLADRFAIGAYLEPYVRSLASHEIPGGVLSPADFGAEFHRVLPDDDPLTLPPAITKHLAVTLDGLARDHETGGFVPVELKTVDPGAVSGWPLDRPHPSAALQAAAQAVVIRSGYAYVYAMVGYGTGERSRRLYRVDVPPGFPDELARRLLEFFHAVEVQEPPEVMAEDSERIGKMFPRAVEGKVIWLPSGLARAVLEREDSKAKMAEIGKEVDALDARIKMAMGDAEIGLIRNTDLAVTYPTITKTEKPRLEEKIVTYRRLSVRQAKRDEIQRAIEPGEESNG